MITRVIYSDNGVLSDLSNEVADYDSLTKAITYTTGQDKIYIGSYYPFNHRYVKLSVVNTADANVTLKYWAGRSKGWKSVVDLLDETKNNAKSFGKSGFLSWTPDKNHGWTRDDTVDSNGNEWITGLGGVTIYDLFWAEITFSANIAATLSWIGHLFSNDTDLGAEFPDFVRSEAKTSFATGKTDWEEQHVKAASIIIDDLKSKKVIDFKDQILNRRDFTNASVMKVAEIIYTAWGDDYEKQRDNASLKYASRISRDIMAIDKNQDAIPSLSEIKTRQGMLTR